eukprot:g10447.t1
MGMTAHPPTIAACKAKLDIPELTGLKPDGVIVLPDMQIVTSKCAISYAWNLPLLAPRVGLSEEELRQALYKYSHDDRLLDPKVKTYLPAVGGLTIYTFGDARKLKDEKTEVTVRVHDECIGSDVFGSDICSCRPYLLFAIEEAVKCAQRGGVGIVIYYRKEGRSLGEVIKFRVYNARVNQDGGDRPEMYFHHTEAIAGIRDARFQTMMPDALNWMGIRRIDLLCSMSNEKYEAITGAGIKVMKRVDLPDDFIKDSMRVELDAKIASGYHSDKVEGPILQGETFYVKHLLHRLGGCPAERMGLRELEWRIPREGLEADARDFHRLHHPPRGGPSTQVGGKATSESDQSVSDLGEERVQSRREGRWRDPLRPVTAMV